MPKLKESPEEQQDKMFAALLAKNMSLCRVEDFQELGERLGVSKCTIYYKVKDPDRFTRKELRRLFRILKFTQEEKGSVM